MKGKTKKRLFLFPYVILVFSCVRFFWPQVVIRAPKDCPAEFGSCMEFANGRDEHGVTYNQIREYMNDRRGEFAPKNRAAAFFYPCPFFYITSVPPLYLPTLNQIDSVSYGGYVYKIDCATKEALEKARREMSREDWDDRKIRGRSSISVDASELYFFRICADFTEEGHMENCLIKRYPWSKKKPYAAVKENWPGASKGKSFREALDEAERSGDWSGWEIID